MQVVVIIARSMASLNENSSNIHCRSVSHTLLVVINENARDHVDDNYYVGKNTKIALQHLSFCHPLSACAAGSHLIGDIPVPL